jgi:hypothetical protein
MFEVTASVGAEAVARGTITLLREKL